jgi:hypothetical protein
MHNPCLLDGMALQSRGRMGNQARRALTESDFVIIRDEADGTDEQNTSISGSRAIRSRASVGDTSLYWVVGSRA